MTLSAKELAEKFVRYRELHDEMEKVEADITGAVLELKESQIIAGVKATYYKPSIAVDYEAAVNSLDLAVEELDPIVKSHSTVKVYTSWKEVAEEVKADLAPFSTEKPERVTVKIS